MPRLSRISLPVALLLFAVFSAQAQTLAPTPPMGWNSWDAYGMSINEEDFKANATVLASMKQLGWQYAVIDEGWYLEEPLASGTEAQKFVYDANGRLIPALNRFPDAANGAGLKPLADWVHAQSLKFGIHLIRGIPRQSVKDDKPIAGSTFKASEAADTTDLCPWNNDNYGIKDNAAGQAWYDAMIGLYATWGIDYLKVDCISDRPYKISEIKQVAAAIKKTGRPIVLSLSPGPTNLSHAEEVAKYAQLWRISDDHWDVWSHIPKPGEGEFPMGTLQAFDRLAAWNKYNKPGSWPDEDMLPIGYLGPHPGWQDARQSRLTHDEEQTEFTLWAISRSPLILGGNLTKLDDFTKSLITNKDLIYVNQKGQDSQQIADLPSGFEHIRVWESTELALGTAHVFASFFNLDDKPVTLHFTWAQLGLDGSKNGAQNIFNGSKLKSERKVEISLPAHGSTVYRDLVPLNSRGK
jgi:alpha-galactosidase